MDSKRKNGEGTVRKIDKGVYEAICQSSIINPETMKYKRFKRRGATEEGALSSARMAMKAWEKEVLAGKNTKIDKKKTFAEYMYEYIDETKKQNIVGSSYYSYIKVVDASIASEPIGNYQLSMLNVEVFKNYYNSMLKKKNASTLDAPFRFCKGCCQWLVDRNLLEENYARQAYPYIQFKDKKDEFDYKNADEQKSVKKVFTTEDIQIIYDFWKQKKMGIYVPVFLFLLDTGLRAQEFASLRLQCIDLEKREICIRESCGTRFKNGDRTTGKVEKYDKGTKNGKERIIKISDLSLEIIEWMIKETNRKCKNGNPENLLYPVFSTGKKRSNATMEAGLKLLLEKCGIDRGVQQKVFENGNVSNKGLSLHALRHTYETLVRQNSENNLVAVALSTGHKTDMKMEDYYTHQLREAVQGIVTPTEQLFNNSSTEQEKPLCKPSNELQGHDEELYEMYLKLKEKFG